MSDTPQQRTRKYIAARRQHPAWLLLASPRAPLVLGCLTALFENAGDGIAEEDALQALSDMLAAYAEDDSFEINADTPRQQAGRELRGWIKRRLIREQDGRLYATDALSVALGFIDSLDNRIMTSTASRLAVVMHEIERLGESLNPDPETRKRALKSRIKRLEKELQEAKAGYVPVLNDYEAGERIREVHTLASGLKADFRRVEDSWREADRHLRQSIMAEQYHRGEVVDRLLDSQAAQLETPEGRVFDSFQKQLHDPRQLNAMRDQLRQILSHPMASKALDPTRLTELRRLHFQLLNESRAVLQARTRSERDVKSFIKTGLAAEHHRVGRLLTEILDTAQNLDWHRQSVRRAPSPLPPIGFALGNLPAAQRLLFKSPDEELSDELDLDQRDGDISTIEEDDFWNALDGLDEQALVEDTLKILAKQGRALTLAELVEFLPPSHDLETLASWLGMAREAGIEIQTHDTQQLQLMDDEQQVWIFQVPKVALEQRALENVEWEF